MEDAGVEESEVTGAAEFAPAPVSAHPFVYSVAVARPPPARRLDETFPPHKFTAEAEVARSSSSSGKAPMPEAPPEEPAPTPAQAAKKMKRVIVSQSDLESLMKIAEWEPLPPLDEEWLERLTALIPNGEQFFADSGFSLEKYRELESLDFVVKNAQTDMVAVFQEQLQEKGYVEIDVTDDDEEGEEGRRAPNGRGRRRFRPGVCKTPGGRIRRLN